MSLEGFKIRLERTPPNPDEVLLYVAWRGLLVTCYTLRKHHGPSYYM